MTHLFDNVLILSPHTDDGELGAGGLIARLSEEGKNLMWVVFSTCEDSVPEHLPSDVLRKEFIDVCQLLGLKEDKYRIFDYRVRYLHEKRQEILEHLVKLRKEFRPDVVIGPSLHDVHQDHEVIANEMVRAFKGSATVLHYELPWNHVRFDAQLFVKLEPKHIDKKMELLKCYQSQYALETY
jgi:LmbE family N-acetylglucosaminyl deacetylase